MDLFKVLIIPSVLVSAITSRRQDLWSMGLLSRLEMRKVTNLKLMGLRSHPGVLTVVGMLLMGILLDLMGKMNV